MADHEGVVLCDLSRIDGDLDEVAGNEVGGRSHRLVSLRPVGLAPKDGPKRGSWA